MFFITSTIRITGHIMTAIEAAQAVTNAAVSLIQKGKEVIGHSIKRW